MGKIEVKNVGAYSNLLAQVDSIKRHNNIGSNSTKDRNYEATKRLCKFLADKYSLQKFANLKDKHVQAYVESLKERGLAPAMIKTDLSGIRMYYDQVCTRELPGNDTLNIDRPMKQQLIKNDKMNIEKRTTKHGTRKWTEKELAAFKDKAIKLGHEHLADMMQLARNTGLRIHEAAKVTIGHCKEAIETNKLTVRGKGGKLRDIPINSESHKTLQTLLSKNAGKNNNTGVFIQPGCKTYQLIKEMQNFIDRYRGECEDPDNPRTQMPLTFHGLRYCYADEQHTQYIELGLSKLQADLLVSDLLGHERDEITRIYTQK